MLMLLLESASNIFGGNAAVALHTGTHDGDLWRRWCPRDVGEVSASFSTRMAGPASPLCAGEGDILLAIAAGGLQMMMSTFMFFWASRPKILKLVPGSSGTFRIVITATSVSFCDAP